MNRIIKFKGRSINNDKWFYGYYGTSIEMGDNGGVEHMYRETCVKLHYIVSVEGDKSEIVYPETVAQYTELNDMLGNEIYDNDRVKYYAHKGTVVINEKGIVVKFDNGTWKYLYLLVDNIVVIDEEE